MSEKSELVAFPKGAQVFPDNYLQQQETFWQIVEMVAITDSTHGVGVGFDDLPLSYVCPFCLESLSRFAVRNGESFPHAPACIVTKARALMSERKQPRQRGTVEFLHEGKMYKGDVYAVEDDK